MCAVCLRRRKECLLLPCKHYQMCEDCTKHIMHTDNAQEIQGYDTVMPQCPTCKTHIEDYIKVYE